MPAKIVIFCALEEEIRPLVRGWQRRPWKMGTARLAAFEGPECLAICAGMGAEAARRAAESVLGELRPALVVSAGFAGALAGEIKIGDIFRPGEIVDSVSGRSCPIAGGKGRLVSSPQVAGPQQKRNLAARFAAQAVDMEGAALAQVAAERGVNFTVMKAISDEVDFGLLDFAHFTGPNGHLQRVRLVGYALLRPWLWAQLVRLAHNCRVASAKLCRALEHLISEQEEITPGLMPDKVAQAGTQTCR